MGIWRTRMGPDILNLQAVHHLYTYGLTHMHWNLSASVTAHNSHSWASLTLSFPCVCFFFRCCYFCLCVCVCVHAHVHAYMSEKHVSMSYSAQVPQLCQSYSQFFLCVCFCVFIFIVIYFSLLFHGVCVCVWERERERGGEGEGESNFSPGQSVMAETLSSCTVALRDFSSQAYLQSESLNPQNTGHKKTVPGLKHHFHSFPKLSPSSKYKTRQNTCTSPQHYTEVWDIWCEQR